MPVPGPGGVQASFGAPRSELPHVSLLLGLVVSKRQGLSPNPPDANKTNPNLAHSLSTYLPGTRGLPSASISNETVRFMHGATVGDAVGNGVGFGVGKGVGLLVGVAVGDRVGRDVGFLVGADVGLRVGLGVGDGVGNFVGVAVGAAVGL